MSHAGARGRDGPTEGLPVCRENANTTDWPRPVTDSASLEPSQAVRGRRRGSLITATAWPQDKDRAGSSRLKDVTCRPQHQLLSWPVAVRPVRAAACDTLKSHNSKSVVADASLKAPHLLQGPLGEGGIPGSQGESGSCNGDCKGLPRGSGMGRPGWPCIGSHAVHRSCPEGPLAPTPAPPRPILSPVSPPAPLGPPPRLPEGQWHFRDHPACP